MLKKDKKFMYSFSILLTLTILVGLIFLFLASKKDDSYIINSGSTQEIVTLHSDTKAHTPRTIIGGQEDSYETDHVDADFVLTEYILDNPFKAPNIPFYDEFGTEYQFADYKDNLIILYFWASWCVGCNQELKQLQHFNAELEFDKIHDLEIIPISIDQKEVYELNSFYKSIGVDTLPIFHDENRKLTDALDVKSLPTTFIIDKQGQILARIYDHLDWNNEQLVGEIMAFKGTDNSYKKGDDLLEKRVRFNEMKESRDKELDSDTIADRIYNDETVTTAKRKPIIIK